MTRHPLDALLTAVLPAGALHAVGGRVRDERRAAHGEVVGAPKDLDYVVVGIALEDVVERLRTIGRVDIVGASFAVVKFRSECGAADIALPRRERSTGSGHRDFQIESGPAIPLVDDLRRRDFRMNAIARRIDDDLLIDPHGGDGDIAARRIDAVFDAAFVEDPLRILRAAQFAARLNYVVTPRTQALMCAAAELVPSVSAERIGEEMLKLFAHAPRPSLGLEVLRVCGALAQVWPELLEGDGVEQNEWHAFDVYGHNLASLDATPPGDPLLRLAALFHDVAKPRVKDGPHFYRHELVGADLIPTLLGRLRLPNETIETIAHLVRHHMYRADPQMQAKTIRRFIRRIGVKHLERLFALRAADIVGSGLPKRGPENELFEARVAEILAEDPALTVRDLAIDGAQLIAHWRANGIVDAGYVGDRRLGRALQRLLELVTDDPVRNTVPSLLILALDPSVVNDSAG